MFHRIARLRTVCRATRVAANIVMHARVGVLAAVAMLGATASAQTPPPRPPTSPTAPGLAPAAPGFQGTIVSGTVHDSIAGRPLPGAVVQLVHSEDASRFARTVISDSLGRYAFDSVPDGRYTLGFFHGMLDSLGMQPVARAVSINRNGALRADLAIPGARRLRDVLCGPRTATNSGAVVIGVIRDARTRAPISGVRVVGQWHEVTLGVGGIQQRMPRRVTTSEENGSYVLCNVPAPGLVSVIASRGADSTDLVEFEVPFDGFMRRELFLGAARTVAVVDSTPLADTLAMRSPTVHLGDARLTGTVVAIDGGAPIVGAVVGIKNGPQTRANERGFWTLQNVPPGSRTLEVRALGHVPVRRSVDVIEGTPPIRVAMVTFKATLDTLKITAGLSVNLDLQQFEQRRKTNGMGRFLTAADIFKRQPLETSQLFRNFAGLELRRATTANGDTEVILMKGVFDDQCMPTIFLNGTPMQNTDANILDNFVRPEKIIGIEVYSPTSIPPQFQIGLSGCGSIVIWARM